MRAFRLSDTNRLNAMEWNDLVINGAKREAKSPGAFAPGAFAESEIVLSFRCRHLILLKG